MATDRLLIFCKAPLAGRAKTRLLPVLSPDAAAALYEASLRDTIALAGRERGRVELWFDAPDAETFFAGEFPQLHVHPQAPGDLGERQRDAFEQSFADGAERVFLLGSDCPTLPESHLNAAFDALRDGQAAVGPTRDGGYYLIGLCHSLRKNAGALLEGIEWSSAHVLAQLLHRAAALSIEMRVLPGWYDFDVPSDLELLEAEATESSHTGRWFREYRDGAAS